MIYVLYTLLAFLTLDVLSTLIALRPPGNGLAEGNSIMAALFARFGVLPTLDELKSIKASKGSHA